MSGLTAAGQINHDESQVTKCYNAARDQARPALTGDEIISPIRKLALSVFCTKEN